MTSSSEHELPNGNGIPVRIDLPIQEMRRVRLAAVADVLEGNSYRLIFSQGTLPVARIDRTRTCRILFDSSGQPVTIVAEIENILDDRTMKLRSRETVQHDQLRDYFRVDVNTPVIASSLLPPELADEGESWRITGETLDVSGNGLMVALPQSLGENTRIRLEIILPTADLKVVQCIAQVVREQQIQANLFQVALSYEDIAAEDRDRIIGCCLSIQRKHLRLRVRTREA
ncbi:MAG: hypothetical protein BWK76_27325 [Desulfobulbaceae bacterium A2]|nr:MAG: hypothetical protein BWK76_27325 [Desulfobulbaceae bacterium A2]